MKTTKLILVGLAVAALAALAAPSFAVGADAKAELVAAIGIAKDHDLDFGWILTNDAGTVSVEAAADAVATSSDATLVESHPGTSAMFTVSGEGSKAFTVTLGQIATGYLTTGLGDDATKRIPVTLEADTTTAGALVTGAAIVYVGGEATIEATDVSGAYTANFTVTVAYN